METPGPDISPSMASSAAVAAPTVSPGTGPAETLTAGRFAELFETHSRTFWCIAVSVLRDRELARDVVQESAIIAMRKLGEFDPGAPLTSFSAWMGQIVRYTALNEARRRTRRRESAGEHGGEMIAERADPGGGLGAMGFDDQVTAALEQLEETARACLLMKVVVGLEYKDIAEALGIPEGTAMSHVFRARKAMRSRLAGTHGPGAAAESRGGAGGAGGSTRGAGVPGQEPGSSGAGRNPS